MASTSNNLAKYWSVFGAFYFLKKTQLFVFLADNSLEYMIPLLTDYFLTLLPSSKADTPPVVLQDPLALELDPKLVPAEFTSQISNLNQELTELRKYFFTDIPRNSSSSFDVPWKYSNDNPIKEVQIDGRQLTKTEELAWVLTKYCLKTLDPQSPALALLNFQNQLPQKSIPIVLSELKKVRQQQAVLTLTDLIDYTIAELQFCLDQKISMDFRPLAPVQEMPDQTASEELDQFVQTLSFDYPELPQAIHSLHGAVIDWYASQDPQAPLEIVILDGNHQSLEMVNGIIHDEQVFSDLNPVYSHEGYDINTFIEMPETILNQLRNEMPANVKLNTCHSASPVQKNSIVRSLYEHFANLQDDTPGIQLNSNQRRANIYRILASSCLYDSALNYVGYESAEALEIDKNYTRFIDDQTKRHTPKDLLIDNLITALRTQRAYENSLLLINSLDHKISVRTIGDGHYFYDATLAREQDKKNVIYVRAQEFNGDFENL